MPFMFLLLQKKLLHMFKKHGFFTKNNLSNTKQMILSILGTLSHYMQKDNIKS